MASCCAPLQSCGKMPQRSTWMFPEAKGCDSDIVTAHEDLWRYVTPSACLFICKQTWMQQRLWIHLLGFLSQMHCLWNRAPFVKVNQSQIWGLRTHFLNVFADDLTLLNRLLRVQPSAEDDSWFSVIYNVIMRYDIWYIFIWANHP